MRRVDGGFAASLPEGRRGRGTSSPPQFGQMPPSLDSAHDAQNVHSNEQILAFVDSGGRSRSQHSQPGLSSSMGASDRGGRDDTFRTDSVGSTMSSSRAIPNGPPRNRQQLFIRNAPTHAALQLRGARPLDSLRVGHP
jgi:hypothetical protein